ncbi:MAG: UbiA family prenyltransferase [Actinomycetota bacterium]
MNDRLRVLLVTARPAVVLLFGLFAATGAAQAGGAGRPGAVLGALVVVAGFLLFCVAVNDLSDEAIDRVNLPGDPGRPLVTGACWRRALALAGLAAGTVSLAASTLLQGPAPLVVACGLALGTAYSVRPVRLADRGLVAALALPAAYVAVPYLVGVFAVRATLHRADLVLVGGLYIGFVGRILLKDFRDVRGDALFGKRTFLVRHGRRRTCALSGACWAGGSVMLLGVRELTAATVVSWVLLTAVAFALLRALASDGGVRRDERLVSALAIVGRGTIVLVLVHLATSGGQGGAWAPVLTAAIGAVFAGQAWTMVVHGPDTRLVVPAGWDQGGDQSGMTRRRGGRGPRSSSSDAARTRISSITAAAPSASPGDGAVSCQSR